MFSLVSILVLYFLSVELVSLIDVWRNRDVLGISIESSLSSLAFELRK